MELINLIIKLSEVCIFSALGLYLTERARQTKRFDKMLYLCRELEIVKSAEEVKYINIETLNEWIKCLFDLRTVFFRSSSKEEIRDVDENIEKKIGQVETLVKTLSNTTLKKNASDNIDKLKRIHRKAMTYQLN